jgi:hypothetical protein
MSRSEGSGPAEQAAADVANLLSRATGLHRVVALAVAETSVMTTPTAAMDHQAETPLDT